MKVYLISLDSWYFDSCSGYIQAIFRVLDPKLFWINPDCGLKTRGLPETRESLRNMVEATDRIREGMLAQLKT
ncbi:hypothetical protein MKX74_12365 [Paenibacillus sp. FSL K6-1230]|uniref:hypothetical protein n=1 Tax=Paenibacillus sp. FSL K6-1230 TaxID=2921603 RepID=UPI0030F7DCBB